MTFKTTSASSSNAASLSSVMGQVISARKGEFETGFEKGGQTREHAMLAKTAGVKHLIVLVNKMDDPTVNWSLERFGKYLLNDKFCLFFFNLDRDHLCAEGMRSVRRSWCLFSKRWASTLKRTSTSCLALDSQVPTSRTPYPNALGTRKYPAHVCPTEPQPVLGFSHICDRF